MFRFRPGRDVITLFHNAALPASIRVNTLLKQVSAHGSETATVDQAADHTAHNKMQRTQFELNVTEDPPTKDQLRIILEYVGRKKASQLIDGARDELDALKRLGENGEKFRRPVTVDWSNGKAVIGDNESEIKKMIAQLPNGTGCV